MDEPDSAPLPPSVYVNFLRVAHQHSEFFLTFAQIAGDPVAGAHLVSALVTSPAHAKSMLRALGEAIERYEARHGEIPEIEAASAPPLSEVRAERA
jgi:hypothetical protein